MSGGQPEETWTDTIHNAINTTSEAVHRAVDAIANATATESSASENSHPLDHPGGSTTTGSGDAAFLPKETQAETTTGMNVGSGASFGIGKTEFSNQHQSATPASTGKTEYSGKTEFSNHPSTTQSGTQEFGSPTLSDAPDRISDDRSDPNPSGPAQGGTDSSQFQSEHPSTSLPPPQSSGPGSATSRGDAPESQNDSMSSERQVNKGESIGSTQDEKSRLKGTTDSGPVSMSGTETSHPGSGATPAGGGGAPVGDPSSGQGGMMGTGGMQSSLKEPPKSEEDAKDPGTGQQYVKSTGVAAEGGDFDAAKPGAGV